MSPTEQQKTDAKKSLSMGCITVLVSFAIVVVGVVVAAISKPDTAVNQIELNGEKARYSIVETVTPKTFNSVVVELDLKGERYYTYRTGKKKIGVVDKRPKLSALAYQIPIRVEVTRVRDDEVIMDQRHVLEIKPHEEGNVAKDKGEFEEFGTKVWSYPDIPKLDQSEELRIGLTLEEDAKYGSRVKSGSLKITEKGQSTVMSVSIAVAIFFLILGIILAGVIFTKWLVTSVIRQKRTEREAC
jgi:flagellar basal body-associated protein FliL